METKHLSPFSGEKGQFQRITSKKKKKSHLQGPFTVSYPQIPQPISSYKNGKGNTIGQERGSQVPDCGVGDEFSMGFIKKSPRYTEYGRWNLGFYPQYMPVAILKGLKGPILLGCKAQRPPQTIEF